jgi:hypothetical protein
MSNDNYLTMPGIVISKSATHRQILIGIQAMATAGDASGLTIQNLIDVGVPVNSLDSDYLSVANGYKVGVAAAGAGGANTLQKICQIVVDANAAQ